MSLTEEERIAIVDLKLSKAERAYKDMCANYDLHMYCTAANRLYYCLFYACSALLVCDGHEAHTHSGNITLIGLNYVKPGIISSEFGKLLRAAFKLRQESDYDDYYDVKKEDIESYVEPARDFILLVKQLIASKR